MSLEQESSMPAFTVGSEAESAQEYVETNFTTSQSNATIAQIVVEDENVLDKETLLSTLELQREIRQNETIGGTLVEDRPTIGIANGVARAAIQERFPEKTDPTISEQIRALEAMNEQQIEAILERLLAPDAANQDALALLPTDYESGSVEANATMIVVRQHDEINAAAGQAPPEIVDSQLAMQTISTEEMDEETTIVGNGLLTEEMDRANEETFVLLGPLALLFVLVTLSLAYRDLLDILLSLAGIVLVLLWTFGALGWIGIAFNPVLIAIPVLLIGLSIDFGIHVFTRYREETRDDQAVATSMKAALGGVGVALTWVTVTTVIGFLSNLASPVPLIREIGLIAAVGIVGALVVFGAFIPPLKTVLDEWLESRGFDRRQAPIGTDDSPIAGVLSAGSGLARNAPVAVLVAVLLVTAGTAVVATDVSTSFEADDTLVEDAPAWTDPLPAPFATSEYTAKENIELVNERFIHPNSRVEFLVEGNVSDGETLEQIHEAQQQASRQEVVRTLGTGEARTTSPLTVIDRVASQNESFNATVAASDTDGDGIPDRNVEGVYDELFEVAPDAAGQVIHHEAGEYRAVRMSMYVDLIADGDRTVATAEEIAGTLDGEQRTAVATGEPIIRKVVQNSLLESLLITLAITLVVITVVLATVYRAVYGSAMLGVITLVPVLMTVSWVFATMYALDFSLNLVTTIVASLAIGLGVDYSIHVSERFRDELGEGRSIDAAVTTTIRGTGAALLGSATTTALGFGILAFSLVPILQQFGAIMAVMIIYAFLAAVFVLPSLLVLWARHLTSAAPSSVEDSVQEEPGVSS